MGTSKEIIAFDFWSYYRYTASSVAAHNEGSISEQNERVHRQLAVLFSKKIDPNDLRLGWPPSPNESCAFRERDKFALFYGRSFCVTEDGRVCNAMNQPKDGGLVAAFQGSDRLWILHPVDERYRLIGDAYIDGLMNGEAYEGVEPDEVDYDIELV